VVLGLEVWAAAVDDGGAVGEDVFDVVELEPG
jgi:hypothetical protein